MTNKSVSVCVCFCKVWPCYMNLLGSFVPFSLQATPTATPTLMTNLSTKSYVSIHLELMCLFALTLSRPLLASWHEHMNTWTWSSNHDLHSLWHNFHCNHPFQQLCESLSYYGRMVKYNRGNDFGICSVSHVAAWRHVEAGGLWCSGLCRCLAKGKRKIIKTLQIWYLHIF